MTSCPRQVSPCGRYLLDGQNTPFTWIGDTAWELFHRLDRSDVEEYLDDRQARGFTVVQSVYLAELDGLRTPNRLGLLPLLDEDHLRLDPAYLDWVRWVLQAGARRGLSFALLPTWGDKVHPLARGLGPVVFTPEKAGPFARNLADALKGYPIIWVLGGDRNPVDETHYAIWEAMARGIRESWGSLALITYHPEGYQSSARYFHDRDWLDFNMLQTGHGEKDYPVHDRVREDLARIPRKPVLDAEPCYETMPVEFWKISAGRSWEAIPENERTYSHFCAHKGVFTACDLRKTLYRALLAGAFGVTYGHNSIWQFFTPGIKPPNIPCACTWKEALNAPGAQQIKTLRRIIDQHGYLQPSACRNPENRVLAAEGVRSGQTVIYVPEARRLNALSFCPRSPEEALTIKVSRPEDDIILYHEEEPSSKKHTVVIPEGESDLLLELSLPGSIVELS